jgi:glycerophosphoryl diester phosphodiesterase
MANAPAWLTARPIAHRGLHDEGRGVVENTLDAAEAAIRLSFAIECDVQLSADGEAMVFHDEALDRLTTAKGAFKDRTTAALAAIRFKASGAKIPRFRELLDTVAGRVPIVCEIKSGFDGDPRPAEAVAEFAASYDGPLAIKSFDPFVIAHLRRSSFGRPLGIVAEASYEGDYWRALSPAQKSECANFLHYDTTRPDFLSFRVDDLPHPTPFLLRALSAVPVMTWTVRSAEQRRRAEQWADQIVFEEEAEGVMPA